jgi:hypothetical protein
MTEETQQPPPEVVALVTEIFAAGKGQAAEDATFYETCNVAMPALAIEAAKKNHDAIEQAKIYGLAEKVQALIKKGGKE